MSSLWIIPERFRFFFPRRGFYIIPQVKNRNTWLIPMGNAWGYYYNERVEQGNDPNRDSPYLSDGTCLKTMTVRILNLLIRDHLFRTMLEFHGGTRALVYPWASPNHIIDRKTGLPGALANDDIRSMDAGFSEKSSLSPDDSAYVDMARSMQVAAGKDHGGAWWYDPGTHTDKIYWIRGGIQDWMYAAAWEASGDGLPGAPLSKKCKVGRLVFAVLFAREHHDHRLFFSAKRGHDEHFLVLLKQRLLVDILFLRVLFAHRIASYSLKKMLKMLFVTCAT